MNITRKDSRPAATAARVSPPGQTTGHGRTVTAADPLQTGLRNFSQTSYDLNDFINSTHVARDCMKIFLIVVVTVLYVGSSFTAWAQDATPRVHNNQQSARILTQKNDTSTSKCVGAPKTPLCAVETFLACHLRRQIDLCLKVGRTELNENEPSHTSHQEYYLISKKIIRKQDIPENLVDADWFKPGYVELDLNIRPHSETGSIGHADDWRRFSYILKPADTVWHVVSFVLVGFENFVE